MNIWLSVISEPFPFLRGGRTENLVNELIARGHSVVVWLSAFDHAKKEWIFKDDTSLKPKDGLTVMALKGTGYKNNISLARYLDHKIVARKFRKMARKMPKPDIIIAAIPSYDLAYEGAMFAKDNAIPALVDIRDLWPQIFLEQIPAVLRMPVKLMLTGDFSTFNKTILLADSVVSMMDSLLEKSLSCAHRERTERDRVFYLGYKESADGEDKLNKITDLMGRLTDKFVVAFIGNFGYQNDISILVDCAKKFKDGEVYFVIAGNGEFFHSVKKKADGLPNVILPGWLNHNEIATLLKHSNIGICPTYQNNDFFPNKAFMYLSAGLPIISSCSGDLKSYIEHCGFGYYYSPGDSVRLCACIAKLRDTPILYNKMSQSAKNVFMDLFNADKIYRDYATHIEKIARDYKYSYV